MGGQLLASLLTALAVEAMQALFAPLVEALLKWQNHRSTAHYERHYAYQLFSISFVNRFFSLFYLVTLKRLGTLTLFHEASANAVLNAAAYATSSATTDAPLPYVLEICRDRLGGPADGCVEEIATLVGALLVVQLVVQNALEYAPFIPPLAALPSSPPLVTRGRYTKLLLAEKLRTRASHTRIHSEASLAKSGGSAGGDFFELTMSYATVALFAGAFPPAAALALLNNAIEARADSYKYLRCRQRPQPRLHEHAGAWKPILQFISLLAILTNTLFVCHASTALPRLFDVAGGGEYALAIILEHLLLLVKLGIDWAIPDVPSAKLERLERQRRLLELAEYAPFIPPLASALPSSPPLMPRGRYARAHPHAPPANLAADADAAMQAAQAAEDEAEGDGEPLAERQREEKMSELGILRSFHPVPEEQVRHLPAPPRATASPYLR